MIAELRFCARVAAEAKFPTRMTVEQHGVIVTSGAHNAAGSYVNQRELVTWRQLEVDAERYLQRAINTTNSAVERKGGKVK